MLRFTSYKKASCIATASSSNLKISMTAIRLSYSKALRFGLPKANWFQLEGLKVETLEGETLGKVLRMMETGANDVMVVKNDVDKEEILIPYVREQVIKQVNLEQKTITVDWQKDY